MVIRPTPAGSLAAQLARLQALGLPGAYGAVIDRGSKLRFDFTVEPFAGAREYRCRIEMARDARNPQAYALSPDLQALADGKPLPHIYDYSAGTTRVCLHRPANRDWLPACWLSKTMVPWTIEWLRYYELWLVDGEWGGGGEHPDTEPRRRYGMAGRRS